MRATRVRWHAAAADAAIPSGGRLRHAARGQSFGETIAVAQTAYASLAAGLVTASLGAARSSLLLALASRRVVGHIPLPLAVTAATDQGDPDAADRTPAADHEMAVRNHLAAAALTGRVRIETRPGSTSPLPIEWLPERAQDVVEVIIPTRDNADDV